MKSHTRN